MRIECAIKVQEQGCMNGYFGHIVNAVMAVQTINVTRIAAGAPAASQAD